MSKPTLKLDWCGHDAATFAVMNWHYSKAMPAGKLAKVGAWEHGKFIGAVIFSRGAAPQAHCQFGITNVQICELTRVALTKHKTPVSRIIAIATRMLVRFCEGIRLIVSYADPEQSHHGGIYQAGGWLYCGITKPAQHFVNARSGERIHSKSLKTGKPGYATKLMAAGEITSVQTVKHKYLMPLDDEMRARIEPLRKPYPKRAGSAEGGTAGIQPVGGGSNPTPALLSKTVTP